MVFVKGQFIYREKQNTWEKQETEEIKAERKEKSVAEDKIIEVYCLGLVITALHADAVTLE